MPNRKKGRPNWSPLLLTERSKFSTPIAKMLMGAAADRIGNARENDGDATRLLHHRRSRGRGCCKNEVGLQRDEFLRESLHRLHVASGPAIVDPDVSALRPPELRCSLACLKSAA